jgi:hypothetical protein
LRPPGALAAAHTKIKRFHNTLGALLKSGGWLRRAVDQGLFSDG